MLDSFAPRAVAGLFNEFLENPSLAAGSLSLAAGKVIFEPDTKARHLYFVRRGQVRLYRLGPHAARLVDILGPNEWFGAPALASADEYGERAVAVAPSVVLEVSAERLMALLPHCPMVAVEFTRQLALKLVRARVEASALIFEDSDTRLVRALLRFSQSAAAAPHADGVAVRITHQQLAQAIGVARETVSLALTRLRRQHLLRTGRNQIVFHPEQLRAFEQRLANHEVGA
jgi:CRP-like cAMP-binding protein